MRCKILFAVVKHFNWILRSLVYRELVTDDDDGDV